MLCAANFVIKSSFEMLKDMFKSEWLGIRNIYEISFHSLLCPAASLDVGCWVHSSTYLTWPGRKIWAPGWSTWSLAFVILVSTVCPPNHPPTRCAFHKTQFGDFGASMQQLCLPIRCSLAQLVPHWPAGGSLHKLKYPGSGLDNCLTQLKS